MADRGDCTPGCLARNHAGEGQDGTHRISSEFTPYPGEPSSVWAVTNHAEPSGATWERESYSSARTET